MSTTTTHTPPSSAISERSTPIEPLSRSYDPPARGPLLLATAGNGPTDAPFRIAAALAERLGVGVEVAGVVEPYPVLLLGDEPTLTPPDFEAARRDGMRAAIGRRLCGVDAAAEQWPVAIFYGDAARTITKIATEHDSTMIVVGLGKHRLLDRIVGGEEALRVLRSADRPVLAVAPGSVALPRTVVVGMDFSAASIRAARAALLGLGDRGVLVLTYVRPEFVLPPAFGAPGAPVIAYDELLRNWGATSDAAAAGLFERVRDELRPYARHDVTIETLTRTGVVVDELVATAEETGAEMIAVGTHGPGALERFFVGSVATDLLRHARRTVLVAPAPNAAEVSRLELRMRRTVELTTPGDWKLALDGFAARNDGRRARLEVDDPRIGAQLQESGYTLLGVTYDPHDERVEIMLGDPASRTRHLTRTIPDVDDVAIVAAAGGAERALRVSSGHSQTLLTFLD